MQPRTRRQREVLDVITRYIENNGHLPSYQMIARHLGLNSRSGVARHVEALESQGLIRRRLEDGGFRLELCGGDALREKSRLVEWLATAPSPAAEDWQREAFPVPNFLLGMYADADIFAFRAGDDGMCDKNICEGDVVLAERRSFAREGSIVVAIPPNADAVVRRFYRNGATIELRPANEGFDTITAPADVVTICGIYRALIRPTG